MRQTSKNNAGEGAIKRDKFDSPAYAKGLRMTYKVGVSFPYAVSHSGGAMC